MWHFVEQYIPAAKYKILKAEKIVRASEKDINKFLNISVLTEYYSSLKKMEKKKIISFIVCTTPSIGFVKANLRLNFFFFF